MPNVGKHMSRLNYAVALKKLTISINDIGFKNSTNFRVSIYNYDFYQTSLHIHVRIH